MLSRAEKTEDKNVETNHLGKPGAYTVGFQPKFRYDTRTNFTSARLNPTLARVLHQTRQVFASNQAEFACTVGYNTKQNYCDMR